MTSYEIIGISDVERGLTQVQRDLMFDASASTGERAELASVWLASFWQSYPPYEDLSQTALTPHWVTYPELAGGWDVSRLTEPRTITSGEYSWEDVYIKLNPIESAAALYFGQGLDETDSRYESVKLIAEKVVADAHATAEAYDKDNVKKIVKLLRRNRQQFLNDRYSR